MALIIKTGAGGNLSLSANRYDTVLLEGDFATVVINNGEYFRVGAKPGSIVNIDRLVLNGCRGVQVIGSSNLQVKDGNIGTSRYRPLVQDFGGEGNIFHNLRVTQFESADVLDSIEALNALGDWTTMRTAIDINSPKSIVEGCRVWGVGIGIQARAPMVKVINNSIFRIAEDCIRVLADAARIEGNVIHDLMGADPNKHYDAIQMWQDGKPNPTGALYDVVVRNNDILAANAPHGLNGSYTQGIIQTDGVSHGFVIENNRVRINSTHGTTLAEAHNCRIEGNKLITTDPANDVTLTLGTNKSGYSDSDNTIVRNNTFSVINTNGTGHTIEDNTQITSADSFKLFTKKQATICGNSDLYV